MGLVHDMAWRVETIDDKIVVTGYLQYSEADIIDKKSFTPERLQWTKHRITTNMRKRCLKAALSSKHNRSLYMMGYIDCLNGFDPEENEADK